MFFKLNQITLIFSILSISLTENEGFLTGSIFGLLEALLGTTTTTANPSTTMKPAEDPAVSRFREYLRLDSSHPNPNYDSCVEWLKNQASEIGLEYQKINLPSPGLFTIVLTWPGINPELKSIMFNSHIDVVQADKSKWAHDPFAADKDEFGNIFGRGAQDRKSLGAQYLEAIRRLKAQNFTPKRTIHVTFVPDEELGGFKGMALFVNSPEFRKMNIGMEFDEGGATPGNELAVYYGERTAWRNIETCKIELFNFPLFWNAICIEFKVIATGRSSHAALMLKDNSGVKLNKVISKLLQFRTEQLEKLGKNPELDAGDVTSINLSQLGGGVQPNIVTSELWAIFDMRIKIETNWTFTDVDNFLTKICTEAGPGVRYEFILKSMLQGKTKLVDSNVWWKTFKTIFDERGLKLIPKFFPGATDARFLRNSNYTALGFCPLPRTEPLQHQDNEFLNENTFLYGITMYEVIIARMSHIEKNHED